MIFFFKFITRFLGKYRLNHSTRYKIKISRALKVETFLGGKKNTVSSEGSLHAAVGIRQGI